MFDRTAARTFHIEDLSIGQTASRDTIVSDRDITLFAEVSRDRNPVHLDEAYAAGTMFKGRIAHGMLTAAFISAVIGEDLPGPGTVYLRQNLAFLAPVRPDDLVRTEVEVRTIDLRRSRVGLATRCLVRDRPVLRGDALVLCPSRTA